jgi:hypothetical protein
MFSFLSRAIEADVYAPQPKSRRECFLRKERRDYNLSQVSRWLGLGLRSSSDLRSFFSSLAGHEAPPLFPLNFDFPFALVNENVFLW